MFEKLVFTNEKEKAEFEKYKALKGTYLHLHLYDLLVQQNNGVVTYKELSSHIKYDKNLRDLLYKYLATLEEWLRAKLLDNYDVVNKASVYKQHCYKDLKQDLICKTDFSKSNLYFLLKTDFSILMQLCEEMSVINVESSDLIKKLRNDTMHHSLIMFGVAKTAKELIDNFNSLEAKLNALLNALPEDYKVGFCTEIIKLNGKTTPYLKQWYLEVNENGRLCIKR